MIVIDTSAAVSIFHQEDDAALHAERIDADDDPVMSVANLLEASIVLRTFKRLNADEAEKWLNEFLVIAGVRIEAVTLDQISAARKAHMIFGKGTGHGAALNFGDCFAYALAKILDAPLLFKGGDFTETDLTSALTER